MANMIILNGFKESLDHLSKIIILTTKKKMVQKKDKKQLAFFLHFLFFSKDGTKIGTG
jgi:hypothetical protein